MEWEKEQLTDDSEIHIGRDGGRPFEIQSTFVQAHIGLFDILDY